MAHFICPLTLRVMTIGIGCVKAYWPAVCTPALHCLLIEFVRVCECVCVCVCVCAGKIKRSTGYTESVHVHMGGNFKKSMVYKSLCSWVVYTLVSETESICVRRELL